MSHHHTQFNGIIPPLCTPMTNGFEVDTKSLEKLITFQLENGVNGLFVLGSTGETAFLTDKQRATVIETAVRTVAGQVPVLAGVVDMTTARVIEHARNAEKAGVDALVVTAPFYTRICQAEILEHFRLLRGAVTLPLFAYDIPVAVHTKITRETMRTLANEHIISGIKDSSGDEANFRGLVMELGQSDDIQVFTGSELLVDAALLMGADGCVPGLGNVDPAGYVRLYKAARAGDWARARQEQERLYRLFEIVSVGLSRMGVGASAMGAFKAALQLRGIIETHVTGRPSLPLNSDEVARVRQIMQAAELL